ncbi:MAG: hypothetical protein Q8M15_16560 [Bacteroidota bacterium]|nr:hypothetical protein [Bacteroidota bacterium]
MLKAKDFGTALKRIKENPDNHGYSKEEYEAIIGLEKSLKELGESFHENARKWTESLQAGFKAVHFSINKFLEKLEETKFIVNDNWFISFNLIGSLSIKELVEMFYNRDEQKFQKFIFDAFPKQQERIFKEIRKIIPHREPLIAEIEKLYNNKYYASVIVLAYTQVDGICSENLGYGFFDTDNKTYDLKVSKLKPGDGLASKIAFQLKASKNEITRYVKKEIENRTFERDSYNRHLVLHGHSINYGSKINAMRAISLLDFICTLKSEGVITENV